MLVDVPSALLHEGYGEPQPAAIKLGFEDAIFLLQVGDHLLLVPLDPANDLRNEDMENHSRSSGWRKVLASRGSSRTVLCHG